MSIINLIKENGSKIIKGFKGLSEEDLFGVSIDDDYDWDSTVSDAKKSNIPPGDDGYGDDEEE
ncbi:MAG: hypothetical protein IJB90_01895 [Clostridia bacterium]|nr:hypothetical protein [Clostridia bacterium]